MERRRRLVIWFVSVFLTVVLFSQGRGTPHLGGSAAFLHVASAGITIRLKGCLPNPGVYRFPGHPDAQTVIRMTAPSVLGKVTKNSLMEHRLESGDIVDLVPQNWESIEISIKKMKAKERMVLGIPLVPDELDLADWESLPGIGPGLAKNIMNYRQKYGDFGSVESLERVPGIGEKKLKGLKRYF